MKQSIVEQMFEEFLDRVPLDCPWTRSQIKALVVLDERMTNILDDHGLSYGGVSWKPGTPYGTLTLRTTYKGEAYVSFTSERSLSICVGMMVSMLHQHRLVLKPDKYKKNLTGKNQVV